MFAWVRQRSGSVWTAAYGHGLFNALGGSAVLVFTRAGSEVDTLHATILGWSGWPVAAVLVVVLLITGSYAAARPAGTPGVPTEGGREPTTPTGGGFPPADVTA